MNTTATTQPTHERPRVTARDRLTFTLFLSIMFNAIVILGITFDFEDLTNSTTAPTLDVILVERENNDVPDEADYLGLHDQSGSGTTQDKARPSNQDNALPMPVDGKDAALSMDSATDSRPTPKPDERLTSYQADLKLQRQAEAQPEAAERPSSAQLIASGQEIARLEAEIAQSMELYSKRERVHRISASTKSFRDAAYYDTWQRKIEGIGNMYYPEEAKRRNLSGSLILEVLINHDGSVRDIILLRSSGRKLLDDAAIGIVRRAAPFSPLPAEMREDTDVLSITRTWRFTSGNEFGGG